MSEECSHDCSSCGADCGSRDLRAPANPNSNVKKVIAVVSGKGGVGKSMVTSELAVTLHRMGYKVGILDADITGPSIPRMFGIHDKALGDGEHIFPAETEKGIEVMSINLMLENDDAPVIWRGPAKMSVLKELLEESNFGELDYLVLDFPPGTGDEVLSACQLIPGDKQALVVTTPQEVSLADCRKCLDFCRQLEVPVAGIVENMAGYVCPGCGARHALFSSGGGAALASQAQVPLLASLPLDPQFLQACDHGNLPEGLAASTPIREGLEQAVGALRNGTR